MEDDSETPSKEESSKSNACCLLKRKSDAIECKCREDGNNYDQIQSGDNKSVKLDGVISQIERDELHKPQCSADAGCHYSVVMERQCTVDVGSQCSVDDGNQCSVEDGSSSRVLPSVSSYAIVETMEEYCSTDETNDCHSYEEKYSQTNTLNSTDNKADISDSHNKENTYIYKLKNDESTDDETESIIHSEKATDIHVNEKCCEISISNEVEDVEDNSIYIDMYKSASSFAKTSGYSIVVHEVSQREKLSHLASVCSNSDKHLKINNDVILMTHYDEEDCVKDQNATDCHPQSESSSDPHEKSQIEASTQTDLQSEENNVILINIIKRLQETISGPEISTEEEEGKVSGKKYHQCAICKKLFQHKRSMKDHVNAHNREKPYSCSVCNKSFSRRTSLQQHRSVHSDVKLHKCDICEKAFSRKYDLKNHQLVHTGEQPFKCELCIKSFKRRHGLNRHMLLHTQGNPYSCELCEVTFSRKSAFVKHQALHQANKV